MASNLEKAIAWRKEGVPRIWCHKGRVKIQYVQYSEARL